MKNKSQKRGLGGKQKEEEKGSEKTKVYKEKTGTEHTFFKKSSSYNRKNISIYLYVLVCDFLRVFMWNG